MKRNIENGYFEITCVHRDDIQGQMNLSDDQMARISDIMMESIAGKMADDYCEQLFWDHLPIIVRHVLGQEGMEL